jgi:hypothetical protein
METSGRTLLQVGNLLAYIFMVGMNVATYFNGWFGETNETVSDKHPTPITPAKWAFSIWSVVFLTLGVFVTYQLFPKQRRPGSVVESISFVFILNAILNGVWAVPFALQWFWLSTAVLVGILVTLIVIYIRIHPSHLLRSGEYYVVVNQDVKQPTPATRLYPLSGDDLRPSAPLVSQIPTDVSLTDYWCARFPFSVYLGWTCVALVAQVAILVSAPPINYQGQPLSHASWAVVAQGGLLVLSLFVMVLLSDPVFGLAIAWGLAAIASNLHNYHYAASMFGYAAAGLAAFTAIIVFFVTNRMTRQWRSGEIRFLYMR